MSLWSLPCVLHDLSIHVIKLEQETRRLQSRSIIVLRIIVVTVFMFNIFKTNWFTGLRLILGYLNKGPWPQTSFGFDNTNGKGNGWTTINHFVTKLFVPQKDRQLTVVLANKYKTSTKGTFTTFYRILVYLTKRQPLRFCVSCTS